MSIRYAILGLLNQRPQSGYELKKSIALSDILPWSGNSNQVYTTLIQLHTEGMVEARVIDKDGIPVRKMYELTNRGRAELHTWLTSLPEPPNLKNHFLVQFFFADVLPPDQLLIILDNYEEELNQAMILQKEQNRRDAPLASGSPRQKMIQQLAAENLSAHFQSELNWVQHSRQVLTQRIETGKDRPMNYRLEHHNSNSFIHLQPGWLLSTEQSAVDLLGICAEHETGNVLIEAFNLPDEFYDLRSGLAGAILGRFSVYRVRAGFLIPTEKLKVGRFGEMVLEMNRADEMHFSDNLHTLITWLTES